MWSAWRQLKDHAKARGISFRLTFRQWLPIARQSDYVNRTGSNGHCLTVDRIDNTKGYFLRNVQFLTRAENTMKQARRDAIRLQAGLKWQENYK